MTKLIIGIDPDLIKSGVAVLGQSSFRVCNMTFFELTQFFDVNKTEIKKVVIEAGWLNKKSNFRGGHSKPVSEQIARKVGENHATGKLIAEIAKENGLEVVLVKPTRKKKDAEEFKRITGWLGRTNSEQRDAGMLIFGMK